MYQNKSEDRVITPAHLLLIPSDSGNSINFLNFNNIGLNTLKEASAFSKIRNYTKVYNSHLVHTPSSFTSKYSQLNSMYLDENSYLTASSFGVKKQHVLYASTSTGSSPALNLLDTISFNQFLTTNLAMSTDVLLEGRRNALSPLSLTKVSPLNTGADSLRLLSVLTTADKSYVPTGITTLLKYPALLENINDDSDKSGLMYPLAKIISPNVTSSSLIGGESTFSQSTLDETGSTTTNPGNFTKINVSSTAKLFNRNGPNSKVLLGDQSIRNLPKITPTKSNLNLSSNVNTIVSNLSFNNQTNRPVTPFVNATASTIGHVDYTLFNRLSSARSFVPTTHPAVLSSSANETNSLEYDSMSSIAKKVSSTDSKVVKTSAHKAVSVGEAFVGSREKTPRFINTSY
jgi:hypothetical protein